MLSTHPSVQSLTALLSEHGIRQVVICPGSRNAPLAQTISKCGLYECYAMVDERSAAFFALGISLRTGQPTAVCCTSGTALLNTASAAAEAYYQGVPLVIISADRPEYAIDQLDDQTIRQRSALSPFVKKAVHIPEAHDPATIRYGRQLISDALSSASLALPGPVHINIPLSEPLFDFSAPKLPNIKPILYPSRSLVSDPLRVQIPNELANRWVDAPKRMILIGQLSMSQAEALAQVIRELPAESHRFVVLSEYIANLRTSERLIAQFDELLYASTEDELRQLSPDLLITLGGHTLSKRVKQWLRKYPPLEHISFAPDGEMHDTFGALSLVVQANAGDFAHQLPLLLDSDNAKCRHAQKAYTALWQTRENALKPFAIDTKRHWTDLDVMGRTFVAIANGNVQRTATRHLSVHLLLGNSSTVRNAQHFLMPTNIVSVQANRGTSGIDGSLSTAVGFCAAGSTLSDKSDALVLCILGDLSFFYDMNALWSRHLNDRMRILLMNNGGGQIFHALPGLKGEASIDQYIAHAHHTQAKGWATDCGLKYGAVRNDAELDAALDLLLDPAGKRPVLIEVFTDMEVNTDRLRDYYHDLSPKA